MYELGQIDLENISDLNVINNPVISIWMFMLVYYIRSTFFLIIQLILYFLWI